MAIGDEIERAAELVAPEIGVQVWVVKAVAAIVVCLVIAWVVWKLFVADGQAEKKHDVAAARAGQLVGQAQGAAGAKAANVVAGNATKETVIHETTRDHYVEITKQPGAGDPVSDPVWDAFVRSVCVRSSAAGLHDCQRLQEPSPK